MAEFLKFSSRDIKHSVPSFLVLAMSQSEKEVIVDGLTYSHHTHISRIGDSIEGGYDEGRKKGS